VRLSLGTAGVLGLAQVRQSDPPTTAYLMLEGRCAADCAFCPQARTAQGRADRLSRVTWPAFPDEEFLAALSGGDFHRACLQVVNSPGWQERLEAFLTALDGVDHPPVSLSVRPGGSVAEIGRWLTHGVERVGIPLDAATPDLYRRIKGGSFDETLDLLAAAAAAFPGRISTHLIVGLGETEREAAGMLLRLHRLGLRVGLFAFTPVPGTVLAGNPPPHLGVYRRLQVARWFLATGRVLAAGEPFSFDGEGRLVGFGLSGADLREALAGGEAFRTSGCPDCNRPYYNERPGGVTYNYPRPLSEAETVQALVETGLLELAAERAPGGAPGPEPGTWRLLETGFARGAWNMAVDEALLEAVGRGQSPPTLRFYGWDPPALSLGYFQDREREVDLSGCAAQGFDCVRRPTGGRAVLHAAEVTYAVVVPEDQPGFAGSVSEAYRAIGEGLVAGIRRLGVPAEMAPAERRGGERSAACFDAPSFYELTVEGRKLVGSAQVRRHGALLQHGAILLRFDPDQLLRCLALPEGSGGERLRRGLVAHVVCLEQALGREPSLAEVVAAVAAGMAEAFHVRLAPGQLTVEEAKRAGALEREKYETEAWNGRRPKGELAGVSEGRELAIRPASPEEAALVHEVMTEAFAEYRGAEAPSGALQETVEFVSGLLHSGQQQAALCFAGDVAVGSVRFHTGDGLYFGRLAVRPGFRRRGVAKTMLAWLEEYARHQGTGLIWCNVRANVSRNVQLYRSLGYEAFDERVITKPDGVRVPVVSMRKTLRKDGGCDGSRDDGRRR
jgi:biotin synthase